MENERKGWETGVGYTGINLGNVKNSNRSAILKLLNDRGAMSRKDIATALGLTPATVTLICADLLSAGILCEKGELEEEKRAGRKKVLIDINYQYRYVLSISIEASDTCVAVCDLGGRCLGMRRLPTDEGREPEQFLEWVASEGKALMWEHGIAKEQVLGVGVSVPGLVESGEGVSLHALRIWNGPVAVGECLRRCLDYPVVVENNIKAFAEAEQIFGCGREQEEILVVKWGPGVGAAVINHNQLTDSCKARLAEIGHCVVEDQGKLCRCGRHGCLETRVAIHPIAERVQEAFFEEKMPELARLVDGDPGRIQARNIREWAKAKDEALWEILNQVIGELARVAVNAITILAPRKVILYGEVFELSQVREQFLKRCEEYDPSYGNGFIAESDLSDRIEYIGPLAVAVNELFFMAGNMED